MWHLFLRVFFSVSVLMKTSGLSGFGALTPHRITIMQPAVSWEQGDDVASKRTRIQLNFVPHRKHAQT
jgi:hypothetical protein